MDSRNFYPGSHSYLWPYAASARACPASDRRTMLVPAERAGSTGSPHMARGHLHLALPAGVELQAAQKTTASWNCLTRLIFTSPGARQTENAHGKSPSPSVWTGHMGILTPSQPTDNHMPWRTQTVKEHVQNSLPSPASQRPTSANLPAASASAVKPSTDGFTATASRSPANSSRK